MVEPHYVRWHGKAQSRVAYEYIAEMVGVVQWLAVFVAYVIFSPTVYFTRRKQTSVVIACGERTPQCVAEMPVVGYVDRSGGTYDADCSSKALFIEYLSA